MAFFTKTLALYLNFFISLKQIPQKELVFCHGSATKSFSKGDLQISKLDCKTSHKNAKTIERRASSQAQNPFDERDIVIDSAKLSTSALFYDNSPCKAATLLSRHAQGRFSHQLLAYFHQVRIVAKINKCYCAITMVLMNLSCMMKRILFCYLYCILLCKQMRPLLENVSRETDRCGLSDSATAAVCTALVCDIGLVTAADHAVIVDKNNVRRERQAFQNNLVADVGFR